MALPPPPSAATAAARMTPSPSARRQRHHHDSPIGVSLCARILVSMIIFTVVVNGVLFFVIGGGDGGVSSMRDDRSSSTAAETGQGRLTTTLLRQRSHRGRRVVGVDTSNNKNAAAAAAAISFDQDDQKYLYFHAMGVGQGAGNIMHGLLAAHLLGEEYGRIVCVSRKYEAFHMAFEAVPTAPAVIYCPRVEHELRRRKQHGDKPGKIVTLANIRPAPNECMLHNLLSSDERIIHIEGNTYPRWPTTTAAVTGVSFFHYYRARPMLLDILPYDANNLPDVVVHLRASDSDRVGASHGTAGSDIRKGLDEASLQALGEYLQKQQQSNTTANPSPPYLVTNRVAWYQFFQERYGWSNPNWSEVRHSAFASRSWGGQRQANEGAADQPHQEQRKLTTQTATQSNDQDTNTLQMWADWYTLLQARSMVYHTVSDFSSSAVHWMNTPSNIILGYNATLHTIQLEEESWRLDAKTNGVALPLVNRTERNSDVAAADVPGGEFARCDRPFFMKVVQE